MACTAGATVRQLIWGIHPSLAPLHECIAYAMRVLPDNEHPTPLARSTRTCSQCEMQHRKQASLEGMRHTAGCPKCAMDPGSLHIPITTSSVSGCARGFTHYDEHTETEDRTGKQEQNSRSTHIALLLRRCMFGTYRLYPRIFLRTIVDIASY